MPANSAAAWAAVPRTCRPAGRSTGRPSGEGGVPGGCAGWRRGLLRRRGPGVVGRLAGALAACAGAFGFVRAGFGREVVARCAGGRSVVAVAAAEPFA